MDDTKPLPPKDVAKIIRDGDQLAKYFGIQLQDIKPGYARCIMTVDAKHANAANIGHGGATFSLADVAFAYASNSHGKTALASQCSISFLAPVPMGTTLIATAQETVLQGRSGIYDITVEDSQGNIIALFRGHAKQIEKPLGRD